MKYLRIVFCIAAVLLLHLQPAAQNDSLSIKKFQAASVPQLLLKDGLRTDFEYKLGSKDQYLQFSPRIFFSSEDKRFFGAGLGIAHKIYALEKARPGIYPYMAYGAEYNHLYFTNYSVSSLPVRDLTNAVRVNAIVGFQLNIAQFIFLDFFAGTGFAYSFYDLDAYMHYSIFEMYNYEYTGIYIPLGFRFGIMF